MNTAPQAWKHIIDLDHFTAELRAVVRLQNSGPAHQVENRAEPISNASTNARRQHEMKARTQRRTVLGRLLLERNTPGEFAETVDDAQDILRSPNKSR